MGDPRKKNLKAEAKVAKKRGKAEAGAIQPAPPAPVVAGPSPVLRFAEGVRGVLYVLLAASLLLAIFLGERGVIITVDRIVGSLIVAWIGKVVLVVLALAFFVHGLKHLRLVH